ncbi:MAG: Stp1/IreP family PP2C-type Ser/Thr phosphatase [Trueperaceae bacterium]
MPAPVRIGHGSDAGRVRPLNEDYHRVWRFGSDKDPLVLLAVADGMGGAAAGEIASKLAIEALDDTVRRYVREREAGNQVVGLPSLLEKAIRLANRRVHGAALERRTTKGMGTTLTCVAIEARTAHVGHVGDSRAWLVRDDRIYQLTRDHSWVEEQIERGVLTEAEGRTHAWRNLITRALGTRPQVAPDTATVDLEPGDVLLLATDGLHGVVEAEEILAEVRRTADRQTAVDSLVALANERGGPDNVTVVAAEVP